LTAVIKKSSVKFESAIAIIANATLCQIGILNVMKFASNQHLHLVYVLFIIPILLFSYQFLHYLHSSYVSYMDEFIQEINMIYIAT